ncbi:MAG: ABC transporter, permease protein (cluster 13, osmolytes) [uncultured Thermomicrobiales bacterium]|uniref:ABC transporter, permease protein (Cluster 13, osmolytes) n=1 Tax=uncultured Thermomicrobiales bacterium TaxID=1645740 RepID=A0A6J4VU47_9BACT|nr:MAG: ABC transporter, permease protein (cluster 13, osmolytes) [uncultured Thermomicrobiales bacterium]
MDVFGRALDYAINDGDRFRGALGTHLLLVAVALAIGIAVCIPLGVLTSRSRVAALAIINVFNTLRVVPSLAILFLALPYFGLGTTPALIALTILALPPILINTDTAFRRIDPAIREAARGMGMSTGQVLRRIEFPLALPVMLAGIRIALTEVIASATLAAFIGAGGLGLYITLGFAQFEPAILLVGALPVALMAIGAELGLGALQRAVQPPR